MSDEVIRFDLLKINKDSKRLCQCKTPKYEIDMINRMIRCTICQAYVDPFEALGSLCSHYEILEDCHAKGLASIKRLQEIIEKESRRRYRNKAFRDMEQKYLQNLFPVCPECGMVFDPVRITSWINSFSTKNPAMQLGVDE